MTIHSQFEKARNNLPKGVAAYYIEIPKSETFCILVEASTKTGNDLPKSKDRFKPLAVGVAFFNGNDPVEEYDMEKGALIALGRALKMYKSSREFGFSLVTLRDGKLSIL